MGKLLRLGRIAAASWSAALALGVLTPGLVGVHRTVLAAAVTVTVIAYVDYRARDRDLWLRLGLWAGAAQRDAKAQRSVIPARAPVE